MSFSRKRRSEVQQIAMDSKRSNPNSAILRGINQPFSIQNALMRVKHLSNYVHLSFPNPSCWNPIPYASYLTTISQQIILASCDIEFSTPPPPWGPRASTVSNQRQSGVNCKLTRWFDHRAAIYCFCLYVQHFRSRNGPGRMMWPRCDCRHVNYCGAMLNRCTGICISLETQRNRNMYRLGTFMVTKRAVYFVAR